MFVNWLKYSGFPTFNTPGEPTGGGGGDSVQSPSEPNDSPAEIKDTESFVLDAFEQMQNDDDGYEGPVEGQIDTPVETPEEPVAETPKAAPKAPAETPTVPAKAGDATPPKPVEPQQTVQPQGAAPEPPARAPAQAAPDEQTLHGLAQALESQRGTFAKALADQRYKLTPEDIERFNTEPDKFIAEMAGRVQVETTQSMMRVLWNQLPSIVTTIVAQKVETDRAEHAFWDANKDLDKAKHLELAKNAGALFRKSYPQADEATFHRNVGQMVRGMLGMTALALQPSAPGQTNGHTPPQIQTPGRVVRQVQPSYIPAGHAAPASSRPPVQKGQWESLMNLIQRDDAGEFD